MPTGTLSGAGKKLWEQVYQDSKDKGDSEEVAARKAWSAVKSAGWHKNKDGEWVKEAVLSEFSLTIKKASYDPKTGERRWTADTSDIDDDSYGDNMSLELFADFIQRIESKEQPPEEYCSEFWRGGEPYVSISHYPDLDGEAAPGISTRTYMDGKFLKAKGRFFDNKVGNAAWNTIKYELEHRSLVVKPVRISIAFLDYMHYHKSSGTTYARTDDNPFCIECLMAQLEGKNLPKTYLRGHLVHYAMTREPVNKRTRMEADMTTRVEDAESIIGKDLAEEIEEKAALVGKAELVVKAETETVEEPAPVEEPTISGASIIDLLANIKAEMAMLSEVIKAMKDDKKKDEEEMDDEDMEECKACGGKKKKVAKSETVEQEVEAPAPDMIQMLSEAFSNAMAPTNQKLDILISAQSQPMKANVQVPNRRSLSPSEVQPVLRSQTADPNRPMSISDYARLSVNSK